MVSIQDALTLAINFGMFTLTFVGVVVAIVTLVKKDK
ncbi:putative holin-like toxin [Robertmurraya sp. GLU-23]|uniref:Holin-like toxin n=1 Tax=Robertmurraya beringensis TaxID=641660 RepID=A0ABV6KTZ5_9BACI